MRMTRRADCVLCSLVMMTGFGAWAAPPAGHASQARADALTQAQVARKLMQACFTNDSSGGYELNGGLVTVDVSSDTAAYEALRRRVWFLDPSSNGRASFKLGREAHLRMTRFTAELYGLLQEMAAGSAPRPQVREFADWAFNTQMKWPSPPTFTSVRVMEWPEYRALLLSIGESP